MTTTAAARRASRVRVAAAGVAVAALAALLAGSVPPASADEVPAADPSAASDAVGPVDPTRDRPVLVTQVAPDGDLALLTLAPGEAPAGPALDARTAALEHARAWAAAFGAAGPSVDLAAGDAVGLAGGRSVVRVGQTLDGVGVHAGELTVVVDASGSLLTVSGGLTSASAPLSWTVAPAAARQEAVRSAARRTGADRSGMRVTSVERVAYDPSLIARPGNGARAAYRIAVAAPTDPAAAATVLVDATGGRVLLVEPRAHRLDRVVCDGRNRRLSFDDAVCDNASARRAEGQPPVGSRPTVEIDQAYDLLGRTSEFFARLGIDLTALIGYDVGDGRGRQLRATVRYCPPPDVDDCPMVNAFWLDDDQGRPYQGGVIYVGDGLVGSADVVAHELAHGVTSATARLAYSGEPGAINESISDVFGELVDQATLDPDEDPAAETQWLVGEGLAIGAVRSMSNPARSFLDQPRQPDRMGSPNWWTSSDDDGGVHINSGVGNKAAYLIAAGGQFQGITVRGLGVDKTAALYWDVLNRLSPGSTYSVLGGQLRQACAELSVAGAAGMTADDCLQVDAAVAATELTARRIRAVPNRRVVTTGGRVRIAARVTDAVRVGALRPHRRASVALTRWAGDAEGWVPVRTGVADSRGIVVFGVRPDRTTRYRVEAGAMGPWSTAGSASVTVRVRPRVLVDDVPRRLSTQSPATVAGRVTPAAALAADGGPARVLVQVRPGRGRWETVAEGVAAADGTLSVEWSPLTPGDLELRVLRPRDALFARGVSRPVVVRVA